MRLKANARDPPCDSLYSRALAPSISCKPDGQPAVVTHVRHQLPFAQWQAGRLLYLDLQYLAWQTFTYVMYGLKTTRLLCSQARVLSTSHPGNHTTYTTAASLYDDWAWGFACNGVSNHRSIWSVGIPGMLAIRTSVKNTVKAVISPVLSGWMMCDYGIGLSLVAMVAWLVTIFTPSLCRAYIKHRWLRCSLLLLHRYTKLIGCWLSLGILLQEHVAMSLMGYFLTIGQYVFSGWQNAMTLVPLKLFVVCGLLEWLMVCSLISEVKHTYPAAAAAVTSHSSSTLYLLSFLLVYLVPLAITAAVEHKQRKQYRQYADRPVVSGAADLQQQQQQGAQQQQQQEGTCSRPRSSCSQALDKQWTASVHNTTADVASSSCCVDTNRDTTAAEVSSVSQDVYVATASAPESAAASCLDEPVVADLLPRLALLLGESTLQDVINEMMASTSATTAAAAQPIASYQALCTATSASIKVSTDHCGVTTLAPLLQSSLMMAVGADSGMTAAVHSACFQGCVQLLGLMYFPRRQQQQQLQGCEQNRGAQCASRSVGSSFSSAAGLLHQVQTGLVAAAHRVSSSNAHVQVREAAAAAKAVSWAGSFIERPSDEDSNAQQQPCCRHPQHQQRQQWWKRMPAAAKPSELTVTAETKQQEVAESPESQKSNILCVCPSHTTVGQATMFRLHLSVDVLKHLSSQQHRLLVFSGNSLLVNQLIELQAVVEVRVPAVASEGVLHVCLVPTQGSQQQQLTGVTHQALLVLPAAAIAEAQQLLGIYQTSDEPDEQQDPDTDSWKGMAALSADVAFLLGSSAQCCSSSSSNTCQLPPGKAAVLKHVLIFLAQQQCWQLMKFVVDATAAAAAATEGNTLAMDATAQESLGFDKPQAVVLQQYTLTTQGAASGSSSVEHQEIPRHAVQHQAAPGAAAGSGADELSSESALSAFHEQTAKCNAEAQDSTITISTESSTSVNQGWRRAHLCSLLPGFQSGGSKVSSVSSVSDQRSVFSVAAVVYYLVCALALRLLGTQVQHSCEEGLLLRVRQGVGALWYPIVLLLTSVALVEWRTALLSDRRECAALFCGVCLCVLPLLASAGLITHGVYTIDMYQSGGWLALATFWSGMVLYRSGCNQVRTCVLLLPLLVESTAAIRWGLQLGAGQADSLLPYGGTLLCAFVCSVALEVASQRRFLWPFWRQAVW